MPKRFISEAELHRIYTAAESQVVRDSINEVFTTEPRVKDVEQPARAEGFAAGLFFGTTMEMEDEIAEDAERKP